VYVEQLATYSAPDRDPRMRVVSVAHLVLLATDGQELPEISAGTDAAAAAWHPVHDILAGTNELAFDHATILRDGLGRLAGKMEYTMVAARLLPDEFTMTQLRTVYEAVWNVPLAPGNFTRKMAPSWKTPVRRLAEQESARRQPCSRPQTCRSTHPWPNPGLQRDCPAVTVTV
jgi:8-oxo-dGTP diphosphatase